MPPIGFKRINVQQGSRKRSHLFVEEAINKAFFRTGADAGSDRKRMWRRDPRCKADHAKRRQISYPQMQVQAKPPRRLFMRNMNFQEPLLWA